MVIQVVNFNLEGITHEEYMGAAKEVAPAFKELSGLPRSGYQMKKIIMVGIYLGRSSIMENYLNSSFYDEVLGDNPAFVKITYKAFSIIRKALFFNKLLKIWVLIF